ncbi:hypothetical protein GmRootV213_16700 [Variovorax sp. V213]|uniref:hypothetical protein n=1 Tax=Variovorax sp. V213 TaxID=3065955 RepID=UPI0034E85730
MEQTMDKPGMAAARKSRAAAPRSSFGSGSERYWAPCLAVALLAVFLFYVALKDLVHESAARAPTLPPAVMPAHVEATVPAGNRTATRSSEEPALPTPHRAPLANATFETAVIAPLVVPTQPHAEAVPAFVEVHKCVTPEGDAAYSDGPCPEGARASTLRVPRNLQAAARP